MDVAMTSTTQTVCPSCGGPVSEADHFCEACGAELTAEYPEPTGLGHRHRADDRARHRDRPVGPCQSCGGVIGPDGYCETCGTKAAKARDHYNEQPGPWVAGVCDRGIRHSRNEDAMAIAADPEPGSRASAGRL